MPLNARSGGMLFGGSGTTVSARIRELAIVSPSNEESCSLAKICPLNFTRYEPSTFEPNRFYKERILIRS
ncbi:hypothetical protein ES703_39781 [subsurface metagenome]